MSEALRSRGTDNSKIAFAALRMLLGLLFLTVWASNLHKGLYGPSGYEGLIRRYIAEGNAPGFWKDVMRLVADHAALFARAQLVSELALGVLLLVGGLIRPVGLIAWIFLTSLWISELGVPGEWVWSLVFPAVIAFLVALVPESRFLSLDARWRR
ncbi:MAG: hypothetical protein ABI927_02940 [Gaiellaceae bacterium]